MDNVLARYGLQIRFVPKVILKIYKEKIFDGECPFF